LVAVFPVDDRVCVSDRTFADLSELLAPRKDGVVLCALPMATTAQVTISFDALRHKDGRRKLGQDSARSYRAWNRNITAWMDAAMIMAAPRSSRAARGRNY
jgi:hypothetical protein